MESFFYLCENRAIRNSAYDYIFSFCDKVIFLNSPYTDECRNFSTYFSGTEYENILSDLSDIRHGDLWGMFGDVCTFGLSDCVKNMIKEHGLGGIIKLNGSVLENLCLLSGEKKLFSTCSHEGYADIDGEFEKAVSDYCLRKIEDTDIYAKISANYGKTAAASLKNVRADYFKLLDLRALIEDEWKPMIYSPPRCKLSYKEYVRLAGTYLTEEVTRRLKKFGSFKELYPAGYPHSLEEYADFIGVLPLEATDIYKEIMLQAEILKIVLYKNGVGFDDGIKPQKEFEIKLNFINYDKDNKN